MGFAHLPIVEHLASQGSPTRSTASTAPPDPRFIKREALMNLLGYIIYMLSQPDGNAKLTIQIGQLNWSMNATYFHQPQNPYRQNAVTA